MRRSISLLLSLLVAAGLTYYYRSQHVGAPKPKGAVASVQDFDERLGNSTMPTLVQFHSGCPVCEATGVVIRREVNKYPKLNYLEVNINEVGDLAKRYEIASLPTVLIFAPGSTQPQTKIVDPDQEKLETGIRGALAK